METRRQFNNHAENNRQGGYQGNRKFNNENRGTDSRPAYNKNGGDRQGNYQKPKFAGNLNENQAFNGRREDQFKGQGFKGGNGNQGRPQTGFNKENMNTDNFQKRYRGDDETSTFSKGSQFSKQPSKSLVACSPNPEEAKVQKVNFYTN